MGRYQTCENAVEMLRIGRSFTDVFWGPQEREYIESWGERPVVLTVDDTLWIIAKGNGFAVKPMPRFKIRPGNFPALYVIAHSDPRSGRSLYELWPADEQHATVAGLPEIAFPEAVLLPIPAARSRDGLRRLLMSAIGSAKITRKDGGAFDPESIPIEDVRKELAACQSGLNEKEDGDLLRRIQSKLKPGPSSGRAG